MRALKTGFVLCLTLCLLFAAGCKSKDTEEDVITLGCMEGNTYVNEFFGLSVQLPENWNQLSQAEIQELTAMGQGMIADSNPDFADGMELAEEETLHFVYTYKYSLYYSGGFNPSFICMAENLDVSNLPVKDGRDYLTILGNTLELTQMGYEIGDLYSVQLGGRDFYVLPASVNIEGFSVQQHYYSAVMKGYSLAFIISYVTEEQLLELEDILNTVQFN